MVRRIIIILLMIGLGFLGRIDNSWAQDQKLNGFSFIYPNRVEPIFITSYFGFAQTFGSDHLTNNDLFSFGEAIDFSLRLNESIGAYGEFKAGFGLDAQPKIPRFSGDASYLVRAGLSFKLFRSEETGSQLTLNLKGQQYRLISGGVDVSGIAVDENYYKSLKGKTKDQYDLDQVIAHAKADLQNNLNRSQFSGTESISLGGFGLGFSQVLGNNFAIQTSLDLMAGNSNEGFVAAHSTVETNIRTALIFNLRPIVPIALESELDNLGRYHRYGTVGLMQSIYWNNDTDLAIGMMVGKIFFISDQSKMIGNLSVRYYF